MQLQSSGRNQVAYRVLESFFRHQKLFWIAVFGITGIVMVTVYLRTKSYVATAATQVLTEEEVSAALGYVKDIWVSPSQQNVNRLNDLLKDDTKGGFLDIMLKGAHLKHPINVDPHAHDPRLDLLRRNLSVGPDSNDVFTIYLTWNNPAECENILRSAQANYIEEAGLSRQASSIAAAKFLDSQINAYRRRMHVAEQALIVYKQNHSGQLPDAQAAQIEQLSSLKAQKDYLNITSQDALLRRKALESRLAQIKPTTVLEQTTASGESQTPEQATLKNLESKKAALLTDGWLPESVRVKDIQVQIDQMKRRVAQQEQTASVAANSGQQDPNVIQTTTQDNPEYRTTMEQLTQAKIAESTNAMRMQLLIKQIGQYEIQVQNLPIAARDLADKTRDYSVLKLQYENLLQQREQTQVKANLDKVAARSTLRPIGTVYALSTLDKKKTAVFFLGSLLLGMIVGSGLIILAEWMDPTIRYEADIERLLGVPVIAALPQVNSPVRSAGLLLPSADSHR